jgi:uncharacterized repeat protein (TIGR03803 family)
VNGEGGNPSGELARGADDSLFGSARTGGRHGFGALFRISLAARPPTLHIQAVGEELELNWTDPGFDLQQSTEVALPGSWQAVSNVPPAADGLRRYRVRPSTPATFYRLTKP